MKVGGTVLGRKKTKKKKNKKSTKKKKKRLWDQTYENEFKTRIKGQAGLVWGVSRSKCLKRRMGLAHGGRQRTPHHPAAASFAGEKARRKSS